MLVEDCPMKKCHACGHPWVSEKKSPGVKEYCERCYAYLHCCRNCRFYNPAFHNECAIPNTEWVSDKTGANFCDEFEFRDSDDEVRNKDTRNDALKNFEKLFGN